MQEKCQICESSHPYLSDLFPFFDNFTRGTGSHSYIQLTPSILEPQPKDFGNANVRKMRQVQAANRRRQREEEAEKNQPMKVLPQSEKYKEVSSKVAEHLKVCSEIE